MTPVLYFHGFASSPQSAKIIELRPRLLPYGIELITPDLNVPSFEQLDFDAMVDHAYAIAMRLPPRAIVGSSMGAQVALSLAQRGLAQRELSVPLVLIAPAIGIAERWSSKLPDGDPIVVFNHARNENAPIHRAFFERMARLHVDDEPPPVRVTAIMGRDDQTVPFSLVEARWRSWEASGRLVAGSRFIEIEEGDHGLVSHVQIIEDAIVEAVR